MGMKSVTIQVAEPEEMDIGKAVVIERVKRGISQGELCRRTLMERSYLSKIERGKIPHPRIEQISRIAVALGMTTEELITRAKEIAQERKELGSKE
jgi:transcriptional regulator with XRE-family HTH domain